METKFIKVPVTERFPDYGQRVIANVLEQNDLGLSNYLWNVSYDDVHKNFWMDGKRVDVEYWLEEVPDEHNIKEVAEKVKHKELFKASKDRAMKSLSGVTSLPK